MENVKLNVKSLAAMLNITIEELAERAGLSKDHLKSVSSGRAIMTAKDIIRLSEVTGVSVSAIKYE